MESKVSLLSNIILHIPCIINNHFATLNQQNAQNFSFFLYYNTALNSPKCFGSLATVNTKAIPHRTKLVTFIQSWHSATRVKHLEMWTILRRAVITVNCNLVRTVSEADYVLICVKFRDSAYQAAVHQYNCSKCPHFNHLTLLHHVNCV